MKIIRFQRPKRDIADVIRCDSCGSKKISYYSFDHSRYVCTSCKKEITKGFAKAGIELKSGFMGYWKTFNALVVDVEEVKKPYRPSKRARRQERLNRERQQRRNVHTSDNERRPLFSSSLPNSVCRKQIVEDIK